MTLSRRSLFVLLCLAGCMEAAPADVSEFQAALEVAWPVLVEHARLPRLDMVSGERLTCRRADGVPGFRNPQGECVHGLSDLAFDTWTMHLAVLPVAPPNSLLCHEIYHFALSLTDAYWDGDMAHVAPEWGPELWGPERCRDALRATPPPPSP